MNYQAEIYSNLPSDQLILFAILTIKRSGEECTFERLIKECFTLFQKSFNFHRYPQWPDSLKLDRPLRDLRNRNLITGNNTTRFELSRLGERYGLEIEKKLSGSAFIGKKIKSNLGRKEKRLLEMIKNSNEYKNFLINKDRTEINTSDLKRLFLGTMETPNIVISKNIQSLKSIAEDIEDNHLLSFFHFCLKKIK